MTKSSTSERNVQVTTRFPDSLRRRAEKTATLMGLTFSDVVRLSVQSQLPDLEREDLRRKNRGNG